MPRDFFRPFDSIFSYKCPAALLRGSILSVFFLLFAVAGFAAVPGGLASGTYSGREGEEENPDSPGSGAQAAASEISGSPWPGVIDHVLQKPVPGSHDLSGNADILINYPSIGNSEVDSDIRSWVSGIAEAFESHLDLGALTADGGDLADDDNSGEKKRFELFGSYKVSRPSPNAVSLTFELWNYTGAIHGNLDVITLNYSLLNGQRLELVDMFEDPELALRTMSEYSREVLAQRLGATARTRMFADGIMPIAENFASLTLVPGGIRINFQPYQVAPWAMGVQKVEMPIEKLLPAGPLLALWGK